MIDEDLEALLPALEAFHARFGRFFRRSEGRAWSRKYLIGLTLPIEWLIARRLVGSDPGAAFTHGMFLGRSKPMGASPSQAGGIM
jgi:hypothetical protein